MKKSAIILGLGALVAGTLPVSAQQRAAAASMGAPVEHAQLGLLEAVSVVNNRVIIALPPDVMRHRGMADPAYESYDTNRETLVEGAGSIMQVTGALAPFVGNVVVVTYVERNGHYFAKRLDFRAEKTVRETRGTVHSIDSRGHTIVVRNTAGRDETMDLGSGPGAAIDSDTGLRRFSDLKVGDQVTVYFSTPGRAELVRIG